MFEPYPTEFDYVPDNIKTFQDDVAGRAAIVNAVDDLLKGERVGFAFRERLAGGGWKDTGESILLGRGLRDIRFLGEGGKPDGANSHALIASQHDQTFSKPHLIAALALLLGGKQFYRIKVDMDYWLLNLSKFLLMPL